VAIAGTHGGEVVRLGASAQVRWRVMLPVAESPAPTQPLKPVFPEVPVYSVGRVGPEHAYVGDMWLIKTDKGSILVDAGGTSSFSLSAQKMKAAGVEPKDVRYVLHSHSHGDHCGAAYLWRTMGARIVAPAPAAFTMNWVMPTLSDYGVWAPRPIDVPLPLKRPGDETEFTLCGLRIKAVLTPGHSIDSAVYMLELAGRRVAFTGDIGSQTHDIPNRCWGDAGKGRVVTGLVRARVLPFKPEFVFRGHGAHRDGMAFLEKLVRQSQEAIAGAADRRSR
jgi:glyoxylase-like metal-dependent hydrolase (beta-lactamase superfamily II)